MQPTKFSAKSAYKFYKDPYTAALFFFFKIWTQYISFFNIERPVQLLMIPFEYAHILAASDQ